MALDIVSHTDGRRDHSIIINPPFTLADLHAWLRENEGEFFDIGAVTIDYLGCGTHQIEVSWNG